eukprot:630809-Pyramimonas_sp.AAC.2
MRPTIPLTRVASAELSGEACVSVLQLDEEVLVVQRVVCGTRRNRMGGSKRSANHNRSFNVRIA